MNRKLKELGAVEGDTVRIRDVEFNYEDEDVEEDRSRRGAKTKEPAADS